MSATRPLQGCTPFSEFLIRNCLEQPAPRTGFFRMQDAKVHHYPRRDDELPRDILAQLEQCHSTDRLAVTR